MKKIALLTLLLIPFCLSAQTDTTTIESSTKEKLSMLENGGCYFLEFTKILTGTADKEVMNFTNSLLKKIGKFSKKNKSKVTLIFITNLSENEYNSRQCTDAETAFNFARAKLGAGVDTMMVYGDINAYGILKILIE